MGAGLLRREARRGGTHSPEGQLGSGNPMSQADTDATTRTTRYRRKPVQRKRPPETGDISRATPRINSICVDNRPLTKASAGRSRAGVFEPLAFPWSRIGREPVCPGLRLGSICEADSSHRTQRFWKRWRSHLTILEGLVRPVIDADVVDLLPRRTRNCHACIMRTDQFADAPQIAARRIMSVDQIGEHSCKEQYQWVATTILDHCLPCDRPSPSRSRTYAFTLRPRPSRRGSGVRTGATCGSGIPHARAQPRTALPVSATFILSAQQPRQPRNVDGDAARLVVSQRPAGKVPNPEAAAVGRSQR